jgi:hypothetical protein
MEQIPYTGSLYFRRMLPGESYTDPTGLRVTIESDGRVTVEYVSPDITFPTVTLTSPTQQQTVSGPVTIAADVPGAYLARATAAQNGGLLFAVYDFAAPFTWTWDSANAVNGTAVGINVRGCDVAGNCSYGFGLTVYPNNAATPTWTPTATRTATPTRTPTANQTPTPTRTKPGKGWGRIR